MKQYRLLETLVVWSGMNTLPVLYWTNDTLSFTGGKLNEGSYTFESLDLGRDDMVSVQSRRYRFGTRTVNLTGNLTDLDLVGLEYANKGRTTR